MVFFKVSWLLQKFAASENLITLLWEILKISEALICRKKALLHTSLMMQVQFVSSKYEIKREGHAKYAK